MAEISFHAVEPLEPEMTEAHRYRTLTRLIERLHRRFLDVIRADLARLGIDDLNAVQALLLTNIGDEEINVRTLMEKGYYLGSNASYNIRKLVEMGYLEQFKSPHDRRATIVRLTAKGSHLTGAIEELERAYSDRLGESAGDLSNLLDSLFVIERSWADYVRFGPN